MAKPDSREYHDAKTNLNSFSNILKRDIRLAKSKYYHDRLNKFKSDSRKTWNIVNDITINGLLLNKNTLCEGVVVAPCNDPFVIYKKI